MRISRFLTQQDKNINSYNILFISNIFAIHSSSVRYFLTLVWFLIATVLAFAQNTSGNNNSKSFFLAYGQNEHLKMDETYSRLPKKGLVHDINFGYEKLNDKKGFSLEARFSTGELTTEGNDINFIDHYGGNFKVRFLKKAKGKSTKIASYWGTLHNVRADVWFPKNNELRYAWDIYWGVGISLKTRYAISSKITLDYTLDFPLIGVLWRAHNNGQQLSTEEILLEKGIVEASLETPRLAHFSNTTYIDNVLKVYFNVSERTHFFYRFGFTDQNIQQPLTKKGTEKTNSIGFNFQF